MSKITFQDGQIVDAEYLKKVQSGTSFDGEGQRGEYYEQPLDSETLAWNIAQRDRIKDWEIAHPQEEPETGLGRLAHDGIVLGYDLDAELVTQGPPAVKPVNDGLGVTVEAGSIILSDGTKASWARQTVQLISSAQDNYLYILEENAETQEVLTVSVGSTLPSESVPHIALAKLVFNAGKDGLLSVGGEVAGHGYIDLRPSVHIGNLNNYPKILRNTAIKSDSYTIKVWDRVIADTSNGSIILTLPEDPSDSDRIAIVDISGTFDRYPVILRSPDDCVRINNSVDDWIVNIRDAHLELFYHAATQMWKFEESPGSDCAPVLGTFLSCGGKEYIGERLPNECPDGQVIPPEYPNPAVGVYQYEPSTSKCYRKFFERVAVYADGQGGLITVPNTPRCDRSRLTTKVPIRNILYVDPTIGDDSLSNTGFSQDRPFRTIERALIEAARESHRAGAYNDRYDRVVIELAPGDYYVDNSPGSSASVGITSSTGLIQRVQTAFTVLSVAEIDKSIVIQVDSLNATSNQPPQALNLGRVLYSESGGVGNIVQIERESLSSSIWNVTLEYVNGDFAQGDDLYYDNLAVVNPSKGGLVVPRGVSIDGVDLRKVRVRPMYVPTLAPVENDVQVNRTSIFKVTGGSYVSLITFTDNPQFARTHNTVTAVTFASKNELIGLEGVENSYYTKISSLFSEQDGWQSGSLEYLDAEFTIVAPIPLSSDNKHQDTQENQTGLPGADSRPDSPIVYPGATRITSADAPNTLKDLPDVNSTRSSSPYIFNCSVRSIFGMNGMHADGALVDGLKSMVTANFTQVSLQTDPNCFTSGTYYGDPPVNADVTGKRYRSSLNDEFKYRNVGFRCSNDSFIQIVSCFVIGNSDHFVAENGGDLSITNSCSDFGDISLKASGYKGRAFRQDNGIPYGTYTGTRILEIIPPLPLSYTPLSNGKVTLEDVEISTGIVVDYDKTLEYILANTGPGNTMPAVYRLYCKSNNSASPYTLSNPPSAKGMGFNQFSYTKQTSPGVYVLTGGATYANRKRMYVNGFDEVGNSILYAGNIRLPDSSSTGWSNLDDRSKIFVWDTNKNCWYVEMDSANITEQLLDSKYYLKKFDYAFRFKLLPTPNEYTDLDFFFNNSDIKIIRGVDKRTNDQRIYKTVLSGFLKGNGIRKPQPFYIMEKQSGDKINEGNELGKNPVTVTQIRSYEQYLNPSSTETATSGKYVTLLTKGSDSRRVFTGDIYPVQDFDEPEATADPSDSISKQCLEALLQRPGITASGSLVPSATPLGLKLSADSSYEGFLVELRRPSTIRASNHTWEWTGYLNYDTSLPIYQGDPLDRDFALAKIITESGGGRVYATGMNEEGSYYIGTTVFDLRSGEQFAIPLSSDNADTAVTNQVFSNVIIQNNLIVQDDGSLRLGNDTTIYFSSSTRFKSLTTGEITASANNVPGVYSTKSRAGLVQLAKPEEIRGAFNSTYTGISDQVAVTAKDLANELNLRFGNSVGAGTGIIVTQTTIPAPGGGDDITQFTIAVAPSYGGFTPLGGIIMWTGHGSSVPAGWALCNQAQTINGVSVPNLSDRFIVASGGSYDIGNTGGANSVILNVNQTPYHRHMLASTGGWQGDETAKALLGDVPTQHISHAGTGGSSQNDNYQDYVLERATGECNVGTSGPPIDEDGDQRYGAAHENRPPYYALAFICRVA